MLNIKIKQRLLILLVVLFLSSFYDFSIAQTFSTKSAGTFPAPGAPARAVVADLDNDGDADILYQTGGNGTVFRFARSNGEGTFTDQALNVSPFANVTLIDNNGSNYHVADFDRDGDMDVWAGANNTTGSYYRNDNGVFTLQNSATFPAPAVSGRATTGDFDKDGDADFLYQTGGNGTAFKYARSNGNGTFTDVPIASSPFAGLSLPDNSTFNYQVADFDGDGDVDLWVGANAGTGSYFKNNNGTFVSQSSATFPSPAVISRAVICDFDTDGDADILYQTGGNGTAFQYARNNGNATFTILAQSASPFASVSLIDNSGYSYYIGDFDHDGDIDVWAAKVSTSASGAFYSKDAAPPSLVSFTPANNSTNVSPTVNITYTFNESVVKGIGNISIVRTADNTTVEAIPVSSSQVTGAGTSWTINPSVTLAGSTQYAVKSDAGSFKNADGVIFAGVSLSNFQTFKTATTLDSVNAPANGTYKLGANLTFSVYFSENITVGTTGGTPYIPITIGSTVRNATYVSGSGTSVLLFRYTVASSDLDNDGITVGSVITLNGGTMQNASSVNAPLTLNNVKSTADVLVDGIAPSVVSINRADADNTNAASLHFTVTFSENVSGVDLNDFSLTTTGTAAGTIASVSAGTGTTITVTVNSVSGNGTLRLDLKASGTAVMDAAGNPISGGFTTGQFYTLTGVPLPITGLDIKASEQNSGIQISWNIVTESNMRMYEVQKSGNGRDYSSINTAQPTNNNNGAASYHWFDVLPFNGNNFYRIKAIANSGEITYSQIALVKTGNVKATIMVYPNPVQDKMLNLQLNNEPKGTYIVQLFNGLGQQMLSKIIEHQGGSATQTIRLSSAAGKGVYQLHITNGENKINKQIIVE